MSTTQKMTDIFRNFRVSTSQGTVTIDDVNLKEDDRLREEKPVVCQIVVSPWVHTFGQEPKDLKSFYADKVEEESTVAFLERARVRREQVGLRIEQYSLNRDFTGWERELFVDFMKNTSFGKGAAGIRGGPQFGKQLTCVGVGPSSNNEEGDYSMEFFYNPLPPDELDGSAETEG